MPLDHNTPRPADQPARTVDEALMVLDEAGNQGLIAPASATELAELRGRAAMGMLDGPDAQNALNSLLASGPAADRALDAIAPLFDPMDVVELRCFNPAGGQSVSTYGRLGVPDERKRLADAINDANGRKNVYFGANPRTQEMLGTTRAAKAADVANRRAAFLDLDAKDEPASDLGWTRTLAALAALGPVLLVQTGNGSQVWFPVEPTTGEGLVASVVPLADCMAQVGADNMSSLPQIARLPNTINLPTSTKRKREAVPRLALPGTLTGPRGAALPLSDLCTALGDVADRLGLPGKERAMSASSNRIGVSGEAKTGWGAPSADLLHMALMAIPNTDDGPLSDRYPWQEFGHAVKGAAVAGGMEPQGRESWLEWCAQFPRSDPDHDEAFWDNCHSPHVGWGTLMRILEQVNPAGADRVKAAVAQAAFAQAAATNRAQIAGFALAPVGPIVPGQIPPRRWLYGWSVIAGFLSLLVAPGGRGKSSLAMVEAVAMASGRKLLDGEKPVRPLRVWVHNAEDDHDEMRRRLAATLKHFGMTHADLNGNLFMTSGRDMKLQICQTGKSGPEVVPGVVDGLVEKAEAAGLDVIILDPLGAMHTLPENDNAAANLLCGALRDLAHRADVAVVVLHHTSKQAATDMDAAGAGASRGASAFVDAARVVRQVVGMTDKEAARLGIAEADRRDYLRVDNGKANLARAEGGRWLQMVDVALGNGAGLWPFGDHIGVVERWTPPGPVSGTASDLALVQTAIAAATTPPRYDTKAHGWVGFIAAQALGLNIGLPGTGAKNLTPEEMAARARVRAMLEGWFRDGGLIRFESNNPTDRHRVQVVGIGTPAILIDASDVAKSEDE